MCGNILTCYQHIIDPEEMVIYCYSYWETIPFKSESRWELFVFLFKIHVPRLETCPIRKLGIVLGATHAVTR